MEVKIIKVAAKNKIFSSTIEAEEIIKKMYADGYALKVAYPSKTEGYGQITAVDLVFER